MAHKIYAELLIEGGADIEVTIYVSPSKLEELWREEQHGMCLLGCGRKVDVEEEAEICQACFLNELDNYTPLLNKEIREVLEG